MVENITSKQVTNHLYELLNSCCATQDDIGTSNFLVGAAYFKVAFTVSRKRKNGAGFKGIAALKVREGNQKDT